MKFRIHFGSILKHFRRPNPLKSILKFPKVRFCKRHSVRVSESPFLLHALGGSQDMFHLPQLYRNSSRIFLQLFTILYFWESHFSHLREELGLNGFSVCLKARNIDWGRRFCVCGTEETGIEAKY